MLRTFGRPFALIIPVRALCLFVALAVTGCGLLPASTLGLTTVDGNDAMPANDDGNEPDGNPVDQAPNEGAGANDPTDANPDVMPPPNGSSDEGVESGNDLPPNTYCEAVADWGATWVAFEDEVLKVVNQHRAQGAHCGSAGTFGPAGPLTMNAALRCAARNHSMDMGTRGYFDHFTPEGVGPSERLDQSGYSGSSWAENIAWGHATPEAVVSGWMSSPGHCANIMGAQFTETGIGYYEDSLWTQTFGRP